MAMVGSGKFTYEVAEGWEQLPTGYSHRDVAGVAVDADDRVYVFNRSEHPVQVHSANGDFLGSWGEGIFADPHGIRIAGKFAYCVDDVDHTLRKFTLDGELLQTWGTPGVRSDTGAKADDYRDIKRAGPPFNKPTNIAIASSGALYVTDGYGNARVHKFSRAGDLEMSWGEPGEKPGEFNVPHSACFDSRGRLLVADRENSRIQLFTSEGEFLEEWTDVARPDDIAVDPAGNVFVAELGPAGPYPFQPAFPPDFPPSRVSVFTADGALQARWGTRDSCAPGSFYAAHGICIDSRGDLYVGEVSWSAGGESVPAGCHTLQKFIRTA